jgi:hypothetical protein
MGLTYFKRYRMEIDLNTTLLRHSAPSVRYQILGWHDSSLEAHAEAKYHSFRCEIDANVFPCLGDREGCLRLMDEITRRDGFLQQATWLLRYKATERASAYCGTVQGIRDGGIYGAIQNLGITPEHRGQGLGTYLLFKALEGFRQAGLPRAYLEVTAQNYGAVRLYHRLGFRTVKTVYKAVEGLAPSRLFG